MSESPSKKHKKHKKHKHKRKREDEDCDGDVNVDVAGDVGDEDVDVVSTAGQPTIKLKIKLGTHTSNIKKKKDKDKEKDNDKDKDREKDVAVGDSSQAMSTNEPGFWDDGRVKGEDIFTTKKAGDDTSDEEREWLDALEAGTLNDSGALTKKPDETLMTSRQRSRLHGQPEEQLQQLPSGYKQPEFTEEQLQRRQQRAKKRREAAYEKQEKDKKQTVDRLLKKQESTRGKSKARGSRRSQVPGYRYCSNSSGNFICIPQGYQLPFQPQTHKPAPSATICGVTGCRNEKKYNCSKTGTPLCSLQCYKNNLSSHNLTSVAVT